MTPVLTAAAERLVSLPGFRWMPGMRAGGYRILGSGESDIVLYEDGLHNMWPGDEKELRRDPLGLPDLTDPATLGCVLAMVREAWGDPGIGAVLSAPLADEEPTWWLLATGGKIFEAESEAECLVNALAAAVGAA